MKILFVSSEVAPFAKTGGLGDVSAALPWHLAALGHDVRVVMPFYPRVRDRDQSFPVVLRELSIVLGPRRFVANVRSAPMEGSEARVYFLDCPALYGREGIYTQDADEHMRFAALSRAALKLCQLTRWAPDVAHVNDWQSALLPLTMRTIFGWDRLFERTKTVLTIHNIGHQGTFRSHILPETGLAEVAQHFHQEQLREGYLSFLLTGILYADAITAVSPTYAREIQTPEHGVRMDPFLRARARSVFGILNGIDEHVWSPEKDGLIPHNYSAEDLSGKARNKAALLAALGLPHHPRVPVIGVVSRLAWQKGFDLCFDVLPEVLRRHDVQLTVLGNGEPKLEAFFLALQRSFPLKVCFYRGFSEKLAHLIEAGADMFLMPSRYEPCGLNQMYSMRYGTVPIVHRTGGLADTVRPWRGPGSGGTGFVFTHFDASALRWALERALDTWGDGRGGHAQAWRELMLNGMRQDFSWTKQAQQYVKLYAMLRGEQ